MESNILNHIFSFPVGENIKPAEQVRDIASSIVSLTIITSSIFILLIIFFFLKYKTSKRNLEIATRNPTGISTQFLREFWEWVTYPLFRLFIKLNISPNQITLISFFFGIISGFLFTIGYISTGGWFLVISGTFDTIDGRIARYKKNETKAGAFFDSVIDRYCDYFIIAGIIAYFSIFDPNVGTRSTNAYLSLLGLSALLGTHLISYSKERGANLGVTDNKGIMQRADRMIVLASATILDPFIYYILNLGFEGQLLNRYYGLGFGLLGISVFANMAVIKRVKRIMKALKEND